MKPRLRPASVLAGLAVLLVAALTPVLTVPGRADAQPTAIPPISPTPQSVQARADGFALPLRVGVVAGPDADPAARQAVHELLTGYGITPVDSDGRSEPTTPVTIVVGGPQETPAAAHALDELGVDGPAGLPAEGYVLAAGVGDDGRSRIVLAGVDPTGTFYAAQTLRQVVTPGPGRPHMPGLVVRDWPAFGFRGGMESFYGPEWSQADRLSQVDFLAAHKMDTFFYGPAGDPRTGTLWDSTYDPAELGRMQQVLDHARAEHVAFIYRISPEAPLQPSRGICHSSADDRRKLLDRFEQLWSIGVRQFVIAWDDVAGHFTCAADQEAYGDDPVPIAAAQTSVVDYVQQQFIDTHPAAKPLITVPTEYWGTQSTPYRTRFDDLLRPKAQVYWTGPQVVSPTITDSDITSTQQAFPHHDLVVWDNYPVNDYAPNRLLLGPVTGRAAGLAEHARGITFNELQEQQPSQIVLFTEADYAWNPAAYDPADSWDRGLRELGRPAYPALRTFAENNHSSVLDPREALSLSPPLTAFEEAYSSLGDVDAASQPLLAELARIHAAPGTLRSDLDDPLFLSEAGPWLDKLELSGTAGSEAVSTLTAQLHGDLAGAWQHRVALDDARSRLDRIPQVVAPGVVQPLLDLARRDSDGWLGAVWYGGVSDVTGSPAPAAGSSLAAAADQDVETAYDAAAAPRAGDALTVHLTTTRPVGSVLVLSDPGSVAPATVQGRTADGSWVDLGHIGTAAAVVDAGGRSLDGLRLVWDDGAPAPAIHEIVPRYADALSASLTVDRSRLLTTPGGDPQLSATLRGVSDGRLAATLAVSAPDGWSVQPPSQSVSVRSEGRTVSASQTFTLSVPDDTEPGTYPVTVSATAADGRHTSPVTVQVQVAQPSAASYHDLVLGADPVGYWRLDEPTGPTAADSADGHDGEYRGSVSYGTPGALTRTQDKDAAVTLTGGYVNVPNAPALAITGPFTLEAWVRPSSVASDPGVGVIERYDSPAQNGYILRIAGGNRVQAWVLGPSGYSFVTGSTSLSVGSWHHIAAVFDGSRLTVYVDGQPDGSATTTVTPGAGSGDLRLGARGDDANQRFTGGLDEVAVYGHALSADEVATHYVTGTAG